MQAKNKQKKIIWLKKVIWRKKSYEVLNLEYAHEIRYQGTKLCVNFLIGTVCPKNVHSFIRWLLRIQRAQVN